MPKHTAAPAASATAPRRSAAAAAAAAAAASRAARGSASSGECGGAALSSAAKLFRDLFFAALGFCCCMWIGRGSQAPCPAQLPCPVPPLAPQAYSLQQPCAPCEQLPCAPCEPCAPFEQLPCEPCPAAPAPARCPAPVRCPALPAPCPAALPAPCPAAPAPAPTDLAAARAFYLRVMQAHKVAPYWSLGNTDSSFIAHHLAAYYDADAQAHSPGVIFDIGANRGNTVQVLISALVPAFACYRYYSLAAAPGAECPHWYGSLIAVEANPPTADGLAARAAFERWDMLDFVLVRQAFTDVAGGVAHFKVAEAGEETASLNDAGAGAGAPGTVAVPLGTVDALRAARGEASRRIFLLKIDAEGFDAKVIKGAEAALRAGHVKFLVAEYNSLWAGSKAAGAPPDAPPAWSLRSSTEYLWGLGYECWLLSPQHFMPLWGGWWDESYEFWQHSNFVCARSCDADMRRLVEAARNVSLSGAPPSGLDCRGPAA